MAASHRDIDSLAEKAAAFLLEAVQSDANPVELARELIAVSQEESQVVFAARLESTAGPAAFLVYVYPLGETAVRARYDQDLEILQEAAERESPGPRPLAHAESAEHAFILATTPASFQALSGGPPESTDETDLATLISPSDADRVRREAATALLRLLRAADAQATVWQAAMQAASTAEGEHGDDVADQIPFNDAESELALFLLDERSIQRLLRVLSLMVSAAASVTGRAGV
ncbi:MAG TPA: hypothetical protein VGR16_06785 [Thermomicrobiales bacterium]|nr:hypothetical protein [Thermomicrobiales bacterium]